MSHYYNKEGEEIDLMEWGRLLNDRSYKIIKQDTLKDGKWVSTVWLGIDHRFGQGLPLIFETMVFPKDGDWDEIDMQRYSTLEEAKKGHEEMCKKYD